jgi:hypothetical protein
MNKLIIPDEISFRAQVSEADLTKRIADEVLEQIGGLDENGNRRPGLVVKVNRGSHGGYTIIVTGPAPARIFLPRAGE